MKKVYLLFFILLLFMVIGYGQPKSVTLQWVNSPTVGVDGYNLYRLDVTAPEYSKINVDLIPSDSSGKTEFTDTSVNMNHRYYYVCRAVILWEDVEVGESGILESINSNQATVFIYPPAPNPPTGLIKKSSLP